MKNLQAHLRAGSPPAQTVHPGQAQQLQGTQRHLYAVYGLTCASIELDLYRRVNAAALSRALEETLIRFPYFRTSVSSLEPLQTETRPSAAVLRACLAPVPQRDVVAVLYDGNRITISFHLAFCDARGVKPFAETLFYHYCRIRYKSDAAGEHIRKAGESLLPGETSDPFAGLESSTREAVLPPRNVFHLPEPRENAVYRCDIKVDREEFSYACLQNQTTPVILLTLLINRAIARSHSMRAPILANVNVDTRKALGARNTYMPCSRRMMLPYHASLAKSDLSVQAAEYRMLLACQCDAASCRRAAGGNPQEHGRTNPADVTARPEEADSERATYTLEYLGTFLADGNLPYLESVHLPLAYAAPLSIGIASNGRKITVTICQRFRTERYAVNFIKELRNLGIGYVHSGLQRMPGRAD